MATFNKLLTDLHQDVVSLTPEELICRILLLSVSSIALEFIILSAIVTSCLKHQPHKFLLFIRESAIIPFDLTLSMTHLTDADGKPILLAGIFN